MPSFPVPAKYHAVVDWIQQVNHKVYVARVLLPHDSDFSFVAGQYCSFILGATTRRNLSITTIPAQPTALELCADVTPMGPASRWLLEAKKGDGIDFVGPLGRFVVDRNSDREKLFVATGTGIAPFRSMIKDALATGWKGKLRLYWGLRYEKDMFWDEELTALSQTHSNFSYTLTLSRPQETWQRARGRVTDHIFDEDHFSEKEYYLCGSREMVDGVKSELLTRKVAEDQIKTELFY